MLSSERLPNWPPPDRAPIGDERARDYIAWVREHAGPLLIAAETVLRERHSASSVSTSSVKAHILATWRFAEDMQWLNVGVVYCSIQSGSWAMMDISIRRDGYLEMRPGWNMTE